MEFIRSVTEDEMIIVFLQAELTSNRFRNDLLEKIDLIKFDTKLIKTPTINDPNESKLRKMLFGVYRGFGLNNDLFEDFPSTVNWQEAWITKAELLKVKYIDYSYWNEISNHTRLAIEAKKRILNGDQIYDQTNDNFIQAAQGLNSGIIFPEMILVSKSENDYLVVLEGHLRLTAYILNLEKTPKKLKVIIGYSKDFDKWTSY